MWYFEELAPGFVSLFLIIRSLGWIFDGKNGNRKSFILGLASMAIGIIIFMYTFFEWE